MIQSSTVSADPPDDNRSATQASAGAEDNISRDEMFDLLKNQRRRRVLRYLKNQPDNEAELPDLATQMAAEENDVDVDSVSSSDRKRVYVGLYQCHLPKMDSGGVINFDKNRGTIERTEVANKLDPYLDIDPHNPQQNQDITPAAGPIIDSASRYISNVLGEVSPIRLNFVLAIVVLCSTTAAATNIPPFDAIGWGIPLVGLMMIVITSFAAFSNE